MKRRKFKQGNLEVSTIGYGCMGLSLGYGSAPSKEDAVQLIKDAYNQGCIFFDTAEIYAMGANEKLVGEALQDVRDKVVIATKFMLHESGDNLSRKKLLSIIRKKLENSLQNLRTDRIELYYQHRVNKDIPVEDVAWCMGELIKEGKILGWGQSQPTEDEIRRAHSVTPLTAIQSEYSIMERMFEKEVIPTCQELGIGFVAFSPLANGILSGKVNPETKFTGVDARRVISRFEKGNLLANQPLIDLINEFAKTKNATPAQISLAWMLHKYDFIIPIPGSRKQERITENLSAANVKLTDEEFMKIETKLSKIEIHGNRTDEDIAKLRTILSEEAKSNDLDNKVFGGK